MALMGRPATRVSTILRKARADIERGWCRGSFKVAGRTDRFCSVGALYDAVGCDWLREKSPWDARAHIEVVHGTYSDALYDQAADELETAIIELAREGDKPFQAYAEDYDWKIERREASVVDFNDDYARSKKPILRMYDRAIRNALRQEWRARKAASRQAVSA